VFRDTRCARPKALLGEIERKRWWHRRLPQVHSGLKPMGATGSPTTSRARHRFVVAVALVCASLPTSSLAATSVFAPTSPPADDPVARIVPPVLVSGASIDYPADVAARPDPPRGEVIVRFVVGTDGVPFDLVVEQSLDPVLDGLALEAVGKLRYEPATLDGQAIEIETRTAIAFEPPAPPPVEPPPVDPPPSDVPPDDPGTGEGEPTAVDGAIGGVQDDPSKPLRLRGTILEAGQRTPIAGATIVIVPADPGAELGRVKKRDFAEQGEPRWQATRRAAADGTFEARGIEPVRVRVLVDAPGFERVEYVEQLSGETSLELKYYLTRQADNPYRTVVRSAREEREEVARRTLTPAELRNLPGTQGDALKALQNFPGVARAPFGLGALAIRGTGPNDSAVFIGHHEVPLLFHFGGLTSVFNSDILERIDFVPGNYDVRYGDALGGIVDVAPRKGRRDGYHGYIDSDLFDTGIFVEGKLGRGSFMIAGRRSYIDLLLPAFLPDDAGIDLAVAPRYWDDQIIFDHPVGGGNLSVRVFGSSDKLRLVASDPNEIDTDDRDRFETSQYFHRADIVYTKTRGPWSFLVTPSYRYDKLQFAISDVFQFDLGVHNLTLRAEVAHRASKRTTWRVGTEVRTARFGIEVDAPPVSAISGGSTGTQLRTVQTGWISTPAIYAGVDHSPVERLTLSPGVRVSYYTGTIERSAVEPRVRAAVSLAKNTTLKGGVGLVAQAPQPVEASTVYGNPRVGLEKGVQTSLGVSQLFPYGFSIDATVYYTRLYDEVAPSAPLVRRPDGTLGPEIFANTQTGNTYGLEILGRKQLTRSLFGWVAYTLGRSERRAAPGEEMLTADFDQTHILTLVGVWKLPRNWQIGGRFRLVSGNPYTPVIGADYDASTGTYLPIEGARNSRRPPPFHQLDLRLDKSFVFRRVKLALYLDVQNVYNRQNAEFQNCAFDFSTCMFIPSLPIIPSIGTKLEF
jgi:TonB family protein